MKVNQYLQGPLAFLLAILMEANIKVTAATTISSAALTKQLVYHAQTMEYFLFPADASDMVTPSKKKYDQPWVSDRGFFFHLIMIFACNLLRTSIYYVYICTCC